MVLLIKTGDDLPDTINNSKPQTSKGRLLTAIGFFLAVFSTIGWCVAVLVIPFLPLDIDTKVAAAAAILCASETAFVLMIPLLGRNFVKKFKLVPRLFAGWVKKRL